MRKSLRFGVVATALTVALALPAVLTSLAGASVRTAADAGGPTAKQLKAKPLAKEATVKVGVGSAGEWATPYWLALEKKEFEKENLNVEPVSVDTSTALAEVARGQLQASVSGVFPGFVNAVSQGLPVVWVARVHEDDPTNSGLYIDKSFLKKDGSLNKKKAKGIKVSTPGGLNSASFLPVYKYFKKNGMKVDDDYSIVPLTSQDSVVALENGSIGGAYLQSPFQKSFEASGDAKLVAGKHFVASVFFANSDWIKDDPKVAAAFFRAMARTSKKYLQGDYKKKAKTVADIAAALKQPEETVAASPSLTFDPALPADIPVDQFYKMWIDVGALNASDNVNLKKLINHKIIDKTLG